MGGDDTETSSQTNAPSNPDVNPTISKLLKGVQGTYDTAQSTGIPGALSKGWDAQRAAANNPDYARGISGATSDYADIASGNRFGMNDPGYAALRAGLQDDVTTGVNATLEGSGRFGSGSHATALASELTKSLGGLDYANFQNDQQRQDTATQMLPSLFAAGQAPGSVEASVGQQYQAAPWYNLGQASAIASGNYGAGGSTSTSTTPATPWWQTGASLLGQFI